ncbi:hypothetical protein [Helicobacter apodemus]|uniref:Uncharacterized protein n=1 Tax=Helicobacter apodemus TaxID=135569 RepID=A0A2U8FDY4_9HELI|nr:hypothetical protein [Helicobacter apodemus]AWI34460.1 hypothetical protein CDV25_06555 [Helicobacter apodemus]
MCGFKIIYIIAFSSRWFNGLKAKLDESGEDYIVAEFEFLEALDFFPFLIEQADAIKVNSAVKSLKIFTSMEQLHNALLLPRSYCEAQNLSFNWASYINIHFNSIYDKVLERQKFYDIFPNPSPRFIKGGYPSIDKQSKMQVKHDIVRDTIVFISSTPYTDLLQGFHNLINMLLDEGFRVLFKPDPSHCECKHLEDDFVRELIGRENFVYYEYEPRLNEEEFSRAIVFVSTLSSTAYSFPVICRRPTILLYPPSEYEKELLRTQQTQP